MLGYNPERQREFLTSIGMSEPNWENMALTLFWSVCALLALLTAWLLRRCARPTRCSACGSGSAPNSGNAAARARPHEGPADFIERTAARFPAQAGRIRAIGERYIALRYGELDDKNLLAELRLLVREFAL